MWQLATCPILLKVYIFLQIMAMFQDVLKRIEASLFSKIHLKIITDAGNCTVFDFNNSGDKRLSYLMTSIGTPLCGTHSCNLDP